MSERDEELERLQVFDLGRIANALERIADSLEKASAPPAATGGKIIQLGETMITGTKVGGTSKFQVVWNGGMTPGAPVVWTCPDDKGIVFTADPADATGNTVSVVDAVADTLTAYTLNVAGTASDSTAVTATAKVPLLTAPATGGVVNQLS